jgi:hypothetical protein
MPIVIAQVASQADIESVREILAEYMAWTLTVEGDAHDAPTFAGHREELAGVLSVNSSSALRSMRRAPSVTSA